MLPTAVRATVGEPLSVTCVIPEKLSDDYDSSRLVFDFQQGQDVESLDDRLISRVNSTAAVLNYPRVPFHWDKAYIGCSVRNSSVYGYRRVRVYCKCL